MTLAQIDQKITLVEGPWPTGIEEAAMRQPYSSGVWITKPGREVEFIAAWREFADWSLATINGGSWAKLLQDTGQPTRFVSFGPWDSIEQMESWRSHPGFAQRVGRIRLLVESLEASTLEAVAETGGAAQV